VRDSGVGLDPQRAERLFDAFFTTKPEGMGMGLSICRTIISAHGGLLSTANNPDHGATFEFTLPAYVETSKRVDIATA
jgi:signal transduction histidine kinase